MMQSKVSLLALMVSAALLGGCGDATTTIVEKEPIVEDDHDDDDHDHGDAEGNAGRLVVSAKDANQVSVFDLNDNDLLADFTTINPVSALHATSGSRYAMLVQRNQDLVEFIDGGLWQEEHGDHFDTFEQDPAMAEFSLNDSRPTHITHGEGQTAVFFDGNADAGIPAAVAVFGEHTVEENGEFSLLHYNVNMHGAAQARGEYLISTVRDADSDSSLPDKIALFHQHDDHFDMEQVFDVSCPGLHGSAQNHDFISFACTDGVVVIEQDGNNFAASKIANTGDFAEGMRVGSLIGHHDNGTFIGIAGTALFSIDPEHGEITSIDWQNEDSARPVGYGFVEHGEGFVVLDDSGHLTILEHHDHEHEGEEEEESSWEFGAKVHVSEEAEEMPEGSSFSMTISHAQDVVYISDPIAGHVVNVDLDSAEISGELELDFTPDKLLWLGIGAEEDGHDH
ncbi:hypothetical protein [Lacimicrobium alkaliphilum]|uniref:5-methyltetrahydrofolate--homocysteine methyltransferase n=1 Tax=Lacimicrobium alkaliphilum TaxID=1526571 RepID=A0A0U2JIS0_9ALTE|nr:hypothetical protein [Lacimicrobium alkaliphilum]ALS98182.1 5-methyltetrahydrofolate--homocysteine methyltransferase [Lacimicrobium alkaliphilum]